MHVRVNGEEFLVKGVFEAEAFVYAVLGTILRYILSQGVGRALTQFDLTGGLNMTFTSLSTIYASLAIFAATLLSTFFPARDAMRISAPAEESGWTLPRTRGRSVCPRTAIYLSPTW